jgi:hypothetical protein
MRNTVTRHKSAYKADLLPVTVPVIIQDINLLAWLSELEPLANLHLLFDGVILQPVYALFLLHVFPQNLLILLLELRYLMAFGEQCRNAVRPFQHNEGVSNATKNHNRVSSLKCRVSHD